MPIRKKVGNRNFKGYFGAIGKVQERLRDVNYASQRSKDEGGRLREAPSQPLCTGYSQPLRHRGRFEAREKQGGMLAQRWSGMAADSIGSRVGSGRLKKRVGLYRRAGWSSGGQAQMSEDLGNHRGIYDGGDNRQGAATL